MTTPPPPLPAIGIFDSGVGGLSVLRALRQQLAGRPLHYLADSGHAPYGDRDVAHVLERTLKVTDHLLDHGVQMVVVACNTATALAIETLRLRHPGLRLVGIEPGVKPAALRSRKRHIGVMATPATLASERFDALVERHAGDCRVLRVPCTGLAAAIERGADGQAEVDALLDRYCQPLIDAAVDTVVLGCTHYPFVAEQIAARLGPQVALLDTADAVARHAATLDAGIVNPGRTDPMADTVRLQTTGDPATLAQLARSGLGLVQTVETVRI